MVKIVVYVGNEVSAIANRVYYNSNPRMSLMHYGSQTHWRDIKDGLRILFNTSVESGWEIHMHTNSIDVIKAIPSVLSELGLSNDFTMIRVGRSAKTSNKGELMETHMSAYELEAMLEMVLEVR